MAPAAAVAPAILSRSHGYASAASLRQCPDRMFRETTLPKRNYGFEKRQKELNKQRKREEKTQRKLDRAKPATEAPGDEQRTPHASRPEQ